MTLYVFANNASSTLASGCLNTDTTLTLAASTGTLFPAPSGTQKFNATIEDTSGNIEIVTCTGRTGDVLTVVRAQEGTTALAFASGSRVELRVTAAEMADLLQKTGGDTLTGTTSLGGVIDMGGGGSIQNGEIAGTAVRGAPGQTANQILVPVGSGPATQAASPILTKANISGNMPSGFDLVHTNMILWWNGTTGSIPAGWHLCDGTVGTPDLRDRFIVGAGLTYALGATGGSAAGVTGSTDPVSGITIAGTALTVNQLPAHSHRFWSGVAATGTTSGKCPDWGAGAAYNSTITSGPYAGQQIIENTGTGATHTHAISGNLAHTHSIPLPPYYALYAIMKL